MNLYVRLCKRFILFNVGEIVIKKEESIIKIPEIFKKYCL